MTFKLIPGQLTLADLKYLLAENPAITLDPSAIPQIHAAQQVVTEILDSSQAVYGINTGFGALAHTRIESTQLENLQQNLLLSHAAGTGELLNDKTVQLILLLKINSLARGYSGVRLVLIEALIRLYNANIYPCIPAQGSVGASGDLAPLAHLSTVLLGIGEARYEDKIISASAALAQINLPPMRLAAKEGLALINGTQVSTALALIGVLATENLLLNGIIAGALSVDAMASSVTPFSAAIQTVRGHDAQITVAALLRHLLQESEINQSHIDCNKVQDPYSIRCQPQVIGACLTYLLTIQNHLIIEANGVSDNPLVFAADHRILSGGNFHAEPVAMAADINALCIAEISALAERRIALLIDPHFSGLPAFLVNNPGLNSGFMIAQVTATALASENKSLAHPACIDSLPTSANQEDHVSMATYAARRLLPMIENAVTIVAIELLASSQGIDFRRPLRSSPLLETVHQHIRQQVSFYDKDRYFAPDIQSIKQLVQSGVLVQATQLTLDCIDKI